MLTIAFENTVYDLGIVLDTFMSFQDCVKANSSDFASRWVTDSRNYLARLEQWIAAYDDYAAKQD